ncbi:siderophore ABC transporter substrate-binding protein [Marinomonas rhizomae]|uniref:Iron complex transport system substrate-binding protein n=1 Tax=Marinomonas rhizomae TaxID=491948 RepID=A0A366JFN1_9GAMM|nr:siderophore ABC transporter substrate-binding protein [Marinomonas rhizomae]RBP85781.1 iron complex transport system substrate-binding protein [Marinomonas rhizomae]RNF75601.1 siderophore ABC transporter substrate-binding protein [Marinomonas rhizomae]
MKMKNRKWILGLSALLVISLQGCEEKTAEVTEVSHKLTPPITIKHELGTAVIDHRPKRVAALDMNEVDFLDQLNIPVAGMAKDFIPHYLAAYKSDSKIEDLGAIVQPNMERVHGLKPDLILMTPLHAKNYQELSGFAPTIYFNTTANNHISKIKDHLLTLGKIFGKEKLAKEKSAELDSKVKELRQLTRNRPEKALVVLHNNGSFSSFGKQSRYGFIFNELGVQPANSTEETGLHGQPISSEFIKQADPDIIYIVDRTAVMERRAIITADNISNPLLRQTKAWKNGHVIFVDADAWYIAAASPTAINIMLNDIAKGYKEN